jgi:protein-tyrosine phosphatase
MSRSEVAPGLFVGSKPSPGRHDDFDVVVLAAMEYQPPGHLFPGVEVIHVPLDDAPGRRMREDEIVDATNVASRVARRLRAGRKVLVTCQMGWNRSALIAALAMHDVYGIGADEIVARMRRARGMWALSNPNFVKLLRVVIDVKKTAAPRQFFPSSIRGQILDEIAREKRARGRGTYVRYGA